MKKNIFYTLCLLFLVGNLYSQQTVWVKATASGLADGSSEANAFGSLTTALGQINSAGDVLRVVGTVPAGSQTLTTTKAFAYTIEGDAGGSTLSGVTGSTARMFTINGASSGQNVTFKNITFSGQSSSIAAGGAVLFSNQAGVTINFENCRFNGNTITSTTAAAGGALAISVSTLNITDCLFKENTAVRDGGAISIGAGTTATLTRCTFYKNKTTSATAAQGGGALFVTGTTAVVNAYNCTFFQNTVGAGITDQAYGTIRTNSGTTKVYNSLFFDNKINNSTGSPGDWGSPTGIGSTLTNSLAQWISANVTNTNSTASNVTLGSSNLTYDDTSGKVRFRLAAVGDATPIAFGSDGKDVGAWDCGTRVAPTFDQVAAICSGATLSALPTTSTNGITGTWSPALNNTATTEYTFTPAVGQCASSTATMTITVNPNTTIPTFTQVDPICSGSSLSALPTTSDNSITGTWSPALNNTATTEYTFTPTAGICASTATMTITVNPLTTDGSVTVAEPTGSYTWALNSQTYTESGIYTYVTGCNTATLNLTTNVSSSEPTITSLTSDGTTAITQGCGGSTLVITGTNFVGVTAVTVNGVAVASYVVNSATQITATLPAGAIASGAVVVTTSLGGASTTGGNFAVNANVTPSFTAVAAICSGGSLSALPTTSDNSITGTWSPALNNAATTEYTFTPTAGQCATTAVMTITVNSNVTPTFTAVAAICSGASLSALPTTSNNSVTGTWSPAINNTATTEYTFTPDAGLCATTATMTITVNTCPDTFTWNGSSSNDWATAANWTKTGTGPDTFPGQTPGRSIDNVVISNGGTPVVASGTYVIYSLAVNNTTGVDTGSILTIDSGATLTVNNTSATAAAVAITLKGGSIVNNGTLNATATNTGASFGIACLVPSVAPSTATEYGYSGSGALNISTTLGNAASGGIQFNGTTANTTYKMLFNGTTTFSLNNTAIAVYALRVVDGAKNPIIIGGAGFTLGTVGAPVNNGLLIMGNNGNSVTVDTGTTLTLNSAATNTAMGINILQAAAASADVNFTNKGTVAILGASSSAVINLSVNNSGNTLPAINKINFENQGTLNVDVAIGSSSNNAALRVPATSGQGLVTITNTGTGVLNLKNSQPFTSVTGCPIRIFAAAGTPAVTINNAGALTFTGQSINFGGLASRSSINNTGTIVSSSEFQAFAVTNGTAGTITFDYNTPATSRSVQFTVGLTAAAAAGATYTDANSNVYTVVFAKVNGTGTGLTGGFALTGTTPATGTLTKTSGTGDATIAYSAITLYEATYLSASDSAFTNNGTVNTGTATNLNTFASVTTSATSVIVPGGTPGVGNTDIANASTVALNGTLKLDIQSIASSTSYDKITNSATGGGFDITNATLDLTGIFTPLGNRNINIVTTNATGTLTGNFASVIGLESKPRWSVNYITGTNGKVQLIYVAEPKVTSLTSDGTIAITEACGGSTLVIKGTDLTGATAVTVNGVAVASFVVDSATQITAILPASSTGAGVVAVTTPGGTGTSAGNFAAITTTPTFTPVDAICYQGSLSVLPTTSTNGVEGTWSPALMDNTATTTYTFTPTAGQCITTATMTIVVNALPELPSTACNENLTWNGTTCQYDITGTPPAVVNCWDNFVFNTTTCVWDNSGTQAAAPTNLLCYQTAAFNNATCVWDVTGTAPTPNAGIDGALTLSASPSDEALFAALTGTPDTGGTWTRPASGYAGTYTYTVTSAAPCSSYTDTAIVTVTASTEIPATFPGFCKGATIATATGATTMKFYSSATSTTPLAGTTALANGKTLYVTEVINSNETLKVGRLITVNNLPATPSALTSTESALICKYIGSETPVLFTATATGASSYIWTAPIGASITNDGAQAFISFENVSTTPGLIGSVSVQIQDANGCISAPKALALTTKVPTAPTSLIMTSADSTPSFKGIITPAVVDPPTPAVYGLVGLNTLTTGIKKVGPYTGTSKVFTLTSPAAVTAASYLWTLPAGVNQLSGGNSNVITVDFADVTPGTTALPIVVQSVGGCGNSTNRTLTLARAIPSAPTALALTNTSQANLSSLAKITKVGPYTGTEIPFTLTATPFTTQGAEATSYAWILPNGVVCTTCSLTTDTTVSVSTTATDPITLLPVTTTTTLAAFSSPTNTITVNLSGATGTGNLDLKVFGVNGAGNSIARTLVLARALPTAPTKLVLTDNAISTTVAVTKVGPYTAKETPLTLTATPFITQGAEATSFSWVLPAGVNVTAGASLSTDNGTTKTWTGTASVLTINLAGIGTGVTSIPLNVYAVNGAGTSAAAKTLTVTSAAPATPGSITTATLGVPTYNPICNSGLITVQVPNVFGVTYTWAVGGTEAIITAGQGTNSITINVSGVTTTTLAVSVVGSNGTGSSLAKSLTIKKVSTCRTAAESIAEKFSAVAYPNPATEGFKVKSSNGKSFGVQVYDMLGRSIEQRQMSSDAQIGSNYAKGVYNVIVNQGANVKTLRVIKN